MSAFELRVMGPPRTKKNSLQIRRTKTGTPFVAQSNAANSWSASAEWQLRNQWRKPPLECPVNVRATFYREKNIGDAVGYYQALADALEKARVVLNDRQIVSWDGTRMAKDAANPRVEVVIEPLSEVGA